MKKVELKPCGIECSFCGKVPTNNKNDSKQRLGFVLEGYDDGTARWYCRDCFYIKYGIEIKECRADSGRSLNKEKNHEK